MTNPSTSSTIDLTEQYVRKEHLDLGFDEDFGGVKLSDIDDLESLSRFICLYPEDSNDPMFIGL